MDPRFQPTNNDFSSFFNDLPEQLANKKKSLKKVDKIRASLEALEGSDPVRLRQTYGTSSRDFTKTSNKNLQNNKNFDKDYVENLDFFESPLMHHFKKLSNEIEVSSDRRSSFLKGLRQKLAVKLMEQKELQDIKSRLLVDYQGQDTEQNRNNSSILKQILPNPDNSNSNVEKLKDLQKQVESLNNEKKDLSQKLQNLSFKFEDLSKNFERSQSQLESTRLSSFIADNNSTLPSMINANVNMADNKSYIDKLDFSENRCKNLERRVKKLQNELQSRFYFSSQKMDDHSIENWQAEKLKDRLFYVQEDVVDWISRTLMNNSDNSYTNPSLAPKSFFEDLSNGEVLCNFANIIIQNLNYMKSKYQYRGNKRYDFEKVTIPDKIIFNSGIGINLKFYQKMENLHYFLKFCKDLGVSEISLFESSDLANFLTEDESVTVETRAENRKRQKRILGTLLELARVLNRKFGVEDIPELIRLEMSKLEEKAGEIVEQVVVQAREMVVEELVEEEEQEEVIENQLSEIIEEEKIPEIKDESCQTNWQKEEPEEKEEIKEISEADVYIMQEKSRHLPRPPSATKSYISSLRSYTPSFANLSIHTSLKPVQKTSTLCESMHSQSPSTMYRVLREEDMAVIEDQKLLSRAVSENNVGTGTRKMTTNKTENNVSPFYHKNRMLGRSRTTGLSLKTLNYTALATSRIMRRNTGRADSANFGFSKSATILENVMKSKATKTTGPTKKPKMLRPKSSTLQNTRPTTTSPKICRKFVKKSTLDNEIQKVLNSPSLSYRGIKCNKISEGTYRIFGDKNVLIRMQDVGKSKKRRDDGDSVQKRVMVRVGGGWDTLENYVLKQSFSCVRKNVKYTMIGNQHENIFTRKLQKV